jgi:enoyl-CoA hydratase/carnithine racemase
MVFGMNRGRYLALTGAEVSAQEAHAWGAVAEVMPLELLRARAWALAEYLAAKPILGLRYSRELLNREVQRLFNDHLSLGLAFEGFTSGFGVWGSTNPLDRR